MVVTALKRAFTPSFITNLQKPRKPSPLVPDELALKAMRGAPPEVAVKKTGSQVLKDYYHYTSGKVASDPKDAVSPGSKTLHEYVTFVEYPNARNAYKTVVLNDREQVKNYVEQLRESWPVQDYQTLSVVSSPDEQAIVKEVVWVGRNPITEAKATARMCTVHILDEELNITQIRSYHHDGNRPDQK